MFYTYFKQNEKHKKTNCNNLVISSKCFVK